MTPVLKWRQTSLIVLLVTSSAAALSVENEFQPGVKDYSVELHEARPLAQPSNILTQVTGGCTPESRLGEPSQGMIFSDAPPPPPPAVMGINRPVELSGEYHKSDDDQDGEGWNPAINPEKKPIRIRYNGLTASGYLLHTLQYAYSHRAGSLIHTLIADFLQTETMQFSLSDQEGGLQAFATYFDSSVISEELTVQTVKQALAAYTEYYGATMSLMRLTLFIDNRYADHQIYELIKRFRFCMELKPLSQ